MIESQRTQDLHLANLVVSGFRGLENLEIGRFGRVTLLTGKNAVGKSTVLDAVRLFAHRGSPAEVRSLLTRREEFISTPDDNDEPFVGLDPSALFTGRRISEHSEIVIGAKEGQNQLKIKVEDLDDDTYQRMASNPLMRGDKVLMASFAGVAHPLPWILSLNGQFEAQEARSYRPRRSSLGAMSCQEIGPGLLDNIDLDRMWEDVLLRGQEDHAEFALRPVLKDGTQRLFFVSKPGRSHSDSRRLTQRVPMIRLKSQDRPVPLRSFGDGALRFLGVALSLINNRDGFLLIDEAENGIHYSIQAEFWRMVLGAAQENNVQVIATTHSYDCVLGFAQAAFENPDVDGRLVQLSRDRGPLRAAELPEKELVIAAQQRIEVRG